MRHKVIHHFKIYDFYPMGLSSLMVALQTVPFTNIFFSEWKRFFFILFKSEVRQNNDDRWTWLPKRFKENKHRLTLDHIIIFIIHNQTYNNSYRKCKYRNISNSVQSIIGIGNCWVKQASQRLPLISAEWISHEHDALPPHPLQKISTIKSAFINPKKINLKTKKKKQSKDIRC